jgi:hypothetical protein
MSLIISPSGGNDTLATVTARGATTSVIPSFTNGISLISNPTYGGTAVRIQGSDGPDGIYGSIQFVDVAGTSVWGTLYASGTGFGINVPFTINNNSLTLTNGNLSVTGTGTFTSTVSVPAVTAKAATELTLTGAGSSTTAGTAYAVTITGGTGGDGTAAGKGGAVNIIGGRSGNNANSGAAVYGGVVNITGGAGNTLFASSAPGGVTIAGGAAQLAGQAGANVSIAASAGFGSTTSADGGNLLLSSGSGGGTAGNNGYIWLSALGTAGGAGAYIGLSVANTERLRITNTGAWGLAGAANYGTSGQVLTSQGNAAPIWTTVSGGSATPATGTTAGTLLGSTDLSEVAVSQTLGVTATVSGNTITLSSGTFTGLNTTLGTAYSTPQPGQPVLVAMSASPFTTYVVGRVASSTSTTVTVVSNPRSINLSNLVCTIYFYPIGTGNVAVGSRTLASYLDVGLYSGGSISGYGNIAIGTDALRNLTNGGATVAVGYAALRSVTVGTGNTAIGYLAGALTAGTGTSGINNTFIGSTAGYNNSTGSNNVYVGFNAGISSTVGSNNTIIGYNLTNSSSLSNTLILGAASTERLRITANGGLSIGATGTAYGTVGQVLTSNGDALPTWSTVNGGITTGKAIAMAMIFGG